MIGSVLFTHFQHLWRLPTFVSKRQAPSTGRTRSQTAVMTSPLTLTVRAPDAQKFHTALEVQGVLDRRTSESFLHGAQELYDQGCRHLLLDLRGVTRLELAGRFALHNVVRLYNGEPLLDAEAGWAGLHRATAAINIALPERVQLLASPALTAVLQQAGFGRGLGIYPDSAAVVTAR